MKQYSIEQKNTYNADEKGFMIGKIQRRKRIFSNSLYSIGKLKGAGEPGSREWITLMACICADGSSLPPCIIYSARSGNLQTSWLDDFDPEEHICYFASSEKGWTNDKLGLNWLDIFDRHTKSKARNRRDWRVLLLDGHGSHLSLAFLNRCLQYRIMPCVYPPHATHRLQPLDVGLFRPLSNFYSTKLSLLIAATGGRLPIGKREFYSLFRPAFEDAFTEKNVVSAWSKAGLFPFDPEVVLGQIRCQQEEESLSSDSGEEEHGNEAIPLDLSWRATREAVNKAVVTSGTGPIHDLIEALKARLSIAEHELRGMRESYKHALRRKQKGRNVLPEPMVQKDTWWSPAKIQQANALHEEEQQQAEEEALEKERQKEERAAKKREQEAAKELRKEQAQERARQRAEDQEASKAAREEAKTERETRKQLLQEQQQATRGRKRKRRSTAPQLHVDSEINQGMQAVEPVVGISRTRGRLRPPQRFLD
jgi:hypothetical protein